MVIIRKWCLIAILAHISNFSIVATTMIIMSFLIYFIDCIFLFASDWLKMPSAGILGISFGIDFSVVPFN